MKTNFLKKIVIGAIAGTAATVPMTIAMIWMHRQIPRNERRRLPPEQITINIAEKVGADEAVDNEAERKALSLVNHFAYGASTGALYGSFASSIDAAPVAKGVGFGLAVWAVSYLGWLPAANILSPATRHPASQNAMMITAHIIWGAALGASFERVSDEA